MSEFGTLLEFGPTKLNKTFHSRIESHFSQSNDNFETPQLAQLAQEERPAMQNLGGKQFVLWWGTSTRCCNVAIL